MKNYYSILEVAETAPAKRIDEAYKKLALLYRPLAVHDDFSKARLQAIAEAYRVLGNPHERRQYDMQRMHIAHAERQARKCRQSTYQVAKPRAAKFHLLSSWFKSLLAQR